MALTAASIAHTVSFSESRAELTPFAITFLLFLLPLVFFLSKDAIFRTS
jgi:hypothetical protein